MPLFNSLDDVCQAHEKVIWNYQQWFFWKFWSWKSKACGKNITLLSLMSENPDQGLDPVGRFPGVWRLNLRWSHPVQAISWMDFNPGNILSYSLTISIEMWNETGKKLLISSIVMLSNSLCIYIFFSGEVKIRSFVRLVESMVQNHFHEPSALDWVHLSPRPHVSAVSVANNKWRQLPEDMSEDPRKLHPGKAKYL